MTWCASRVWPGSARSAKLRAQHETLSARSASLDAGVALSADGRLLDIGGGTGQVITYAKFGDHVLDDEEDFRRMTNDVGELCSKFYEFDLRSPTSG